MSAPSLAATLYVVATPIGNLADLSPRALETLRTVAAICAEDTRHTRQLLAHFGIDRPLLALHEHAGELSQKKLVERLRVDPGALTRQLKALEALGWIARSVDPRDNRISNVVLTEEGRRILRNFLDL